MATLIHDVTDLQNISLDLAGDYELANNIDATATVGWNGGLGFDPIGTLASSFTGTLDGKVFTIDGLVINRPAEDYVGLFGCVSESSIIQNVELTNVDITGDDYVGALVGLSMDPNISHCSAQGVITGDACVGGLIGGAGPGGG